MHPIWKIILIISICINLVAIWGFFHYIKYGGSPLGELKRVLTGSTKQPVATHPYAEQNEILKKEIAQSDSNRWVVFFGASITRRWDLDRDFPEVHMINRGVGGQLVPDMIVRYKRDVLDVKPNAVIIKFCSINIRPKMRLESMQDALIMMVTMAQAEKITPIVTTIIPAGKPEATIGDFSVKENLDKYNNWVRDYAKQQNLKFIDFARAIADDEGFLPRACSTDPVHVNEDGYKKLAAAVHPVLADIFKLEN